MSLGRHGTPLGVSALWGRLGKVDVDMERRRVLAATAYSVAALAVPDEPWWTQMAARGTAGLPLAPVASAVVI